MHLAQLNIAELKYPISDPRLSGFVDNLARINALAERCDGFVWRLQDAGGDATRIKSPWPENMIVNMSVWQTPEALEQFVWNTVHKQIYKQRAEWFETLNSHHFVMWWVAQGHEPSLNEAKARLDHLDAHGNDGFAFNWSHLPNVKLWQSEACA